MAARASRQIKQRWGVTRAIESLSCTGLHIYAGQEGGYSLRPHPLKTLMFCALLGSHLHSNLHRRAVPIAISERSVRVRDPVERFHDPVDRLG